MTLSKTLLILLIAGALILFTGLRNFVKESLKALFIVFGAVLIAIAVYGFFVRLL